MFGKKKVFNKLRLGVEVRKCAECSSFLRPCLVDDKPATFHRWVEEDKGVLRVNGFISPTEQDRLIRRFREDGICPQGCSIETLHEIKALIEWPDGSVGMVAPRLVQFLDNREG